MARSTAVSIENNFVNGLVTQATGLNFPESAVTDCDNVVFSEVGNVLRRKGFDFEADFQAHTVSDPDKVLNSYLWQNVAGSGDNTFVVVQAGVRLYFYKVAKSGSLSSARMASTVDLTDFAATGSPTPGNQEAQFASGYGRLFVVHPTVEPFYIEYNETTQTFTGVRLNLRIRDTEGIDEGVAITARLRTITADHRYNLENQGWTSNKINAFYDGKDSPYYPSNADVWWLYKDDEENFSRSMVSKVDRGNSPAPKGNKILAAFNQIRGSRVTSSGYQRPSCVSFFVGRAFYAGVQAQNFSNKIYFSQIIDQMSKAALCHQQNDPTSEYSFDLLPNDGGVIDIPEAGTIVKLFSQSGTLLVFATNGVWSITGSTGSGFAANDYTIRKISATPAINASSFVDIAGYPAWWNYDGIYMVSGADQFGQVNIQSLTEKKIKSWYNDIPTDSKKYVKGSYNSLTKIVTWLYRTDDIEDVADRTRYDRALMFNVVTQAFYPYSFDTSKVRFHGVVTMQGVGTDTTLDDVYSNSNVPVSDNASAVLQVEGISTQSKAAVTKFLVSYDTGSQYLTFGEEYSQAYEDWKSFDLVGSPYDSHFTTGFKIRGDAQRKFQTNYLYVFGDTDDGEESEVSVQALWNYSKDSSTGKWSTVQKVNFFDDRFSHGWKRLKIRGSGLAVQFRFSSTGTLPFNVVGWTGWDTGNSAV